MQSPTDPGWRAHPDAPGWEAYWDGAAWTSGVRRATDDGAGASTFEYELEVRWSPDDVPKNWLPILTEVLSHGGYTIQAQVAGTATYSRQYSPAIFMLLYVVAFPIALLLWRRRPTQALTASWSEGPEGGSAIRIRSSDERLIRLFDEAEGARRVA